MKDFIIVFGYGGGKRKVRREEGRKKDIISKGMSTFQEGCFEKPLIVAFPSQRIREIALSSSYPTLPYGTGGEEYFPLKKREEEGYLQNLLGSGKNCPILPVFRVPSVVPTTGTQQTLKALHKKNYLTFQKLFEYSRNSLNKFILR